MKISPSRISTLCSLLTLYFSCGASAYAAINYISINNGLGTQVGNPNVIAIDFSELDAFFGEALPVDFEEDVVIHPSGYASATGSNPAYIGNDGTGNSRLYSFGEPVDNSVFFGQTSLSINNFATDAGPVYVGFAIQLDTGNPGTQVNYAWAKMSVNSSDELALYEFAYESDLNTPILTGATGIPEPAHSALYISGLVVALLAQRNRKTT